MAWGGIAQPGENGAYPPIGNGLYPDGNELHASTIREALYINRRNEMFAPNQQEIVEFVDKSGFYRLKKGSYPHQSKRGNHLSSFSFGGPGGKCG